MYKHGLLKIAKSKTIDEPKLMTNSECLIVFTKRVLSSGKGKTVFHPSPIFFHCGFIGTITSLYSSKVASYLEVKSTGHLLKIIPKLYPFWFSSLTAFAVSLRYCWSSGQVVISSPE